MPGLGPGEPHAGGPAGPAQLEPLRHHAQGHAPHGARPVTAPDHVDQPPALLGGAAAGPPRRRGAGRVARGSRRRRRAQLHVRSPPHRRHERCPRPAASRLPRPPSLCWAEAAREPNMDDAAQAGGAWRGRHAPCLALLHCRVESCMPAVLWSARSGCACASWRASASNCKAARILVSGRAPPGRFGPVTAAGLPAMRGEGSAAL